MGLFDKLDLANDTVMYSLEKIWEFRQHYDSIFTWNTGDERTTEFNCILHQSAPEADERTVALR